MVVQHQPDARFRPSRERRIVSLSGQIANTAGPKADTRERVSNLAVVIDVPIFRVRRRKP
jgi:hypothetical protein